MTIYETVIKNWLLVPLSLRRQYWRETDYGAKPPSFELLVAMEASIRENPNAKR